MRVGEIYDFAVVGAGIAGASLASELASDASVIVLEAEDLPGYHTTGRSAAFWEECYGGPEIVPLTLASGPLLEQRGVLTPRFGLFIGREEDEAQIAQFFKRFEGSGVQIEAIGTRALQELVPGLREEWCRGVLQPNCKDIDVGALHGQYLSEARKGGADFAYRAHVHMAERKDGVWHITTEKGEVHRARVLVNAAGAWADDVAVRAGAKRLGITPYLRHMAQLELDHEAPANLPLVLDISGSFYFRPDNGKLWLSPHDEIPSVPHDAAPDDIAIATVIERLQDVTRWRVKRLERKWAGLRSFAADRLPIYGFDPEVEGFAWFAGQGGYGIQTAPAAAILMADELLGRAPSDAVKAINRANYTPDRFSSVEAAY